MIIENLSLHEQSMKMAVGYKSKKLHKQGQNFVKKNLVASRASDLKMLLALTKIHWPSIIHGNALVA